jgi:hypothetical protein
MREYRSVHSDLRMERRRSINRGIVPAELDGEALPRNRAQIVLAGDDAPHARDRHG